MMEQIAEIAHGTVRALGVASGTVDLPTWQILPSGERGVYRRAVEFALCESAAMSADPITERMARLAYENEERVFRGDERVEWNGLSEAMRLQWRLTVAVSRVLAMGATVLPMDPGTSVPANAVPVNGWEVNKQ